MSRNKGKILYAKRNIGIKITRMDPLLIYCRIKCDLLYLLLFVYSGYVYYLKLLKIFTLNLGKYRYDTTRRVIDILNLMFYVELIGFVALLINLPPSLVTISICQKFTTLRETIILVIL